MIYDPRLWVKHYDSGISSDLDIKEGSLISHIEDIYSRFSESPAMNFLGKKMNYKEVMEQADRFAQGLYQKGLGKGDVVVLHMPNTPHHLFSLIGALKAGCTVSGMSPLLVSSEIEGQLNDCKAKVLVTLDIMFEQRLMKIKDNLPHLQYIFTTNIGDYLSPIKRVLGKLLKKIPSGVIAPIEGKVVRSFIDFCKEFPAKSPSIEIKSEDDCFIQYTGGTTGPSKGAVLTNKNMLAVMAILDVWLKPVKGGERNLAIFPYFHTAGLAICCDTLLNAGEQTLIPNPRDMKHLIKEWRSLKPTRAVMAPALFTMLLAEEKFHKLDFSYTKYCYSGSAPFSIEALIEVEELIGKGKISEAYGMTETCGMISGTPLLGLKKVGTVGVPFPSTLVKIMDIETGEKEMPLGEHGEIMAHGPQIMKGYLNKPEETAKVLREYDGKIYMHTGDVGMMDEDGYITIVDRVKDMVIVGGFKVFSSEVELKFYKNHAIKFCAIVGVPNPERPGSEIVKLIVQKSEHHQDLPNDKLKEELLSFAKENMAAYKVPKFIEIVNEMPLTAVGKVDKKRLREL
jgi:acyl-CoA synthetase (AMP-forming)/AMP-acid ligase II